MEFILYIIEKGIFITGLLVWGLVIVFSLFTIGANLSNSSCTGDCNQGRNCTCKDKWSKS